MGTLKIRNLSKMTLPISTPELKFLAIVSFSWFLFDFEDG